MPFITSVVYRTHREKKSSYKTKGEHTKTKVYKVLSAVGKLHSFINNIKLTHCEMIYISIVNPLILFSFHEVQAAKTLEIA